MTDEPATDSVITAGWAVTLSQRARYEPVFAGDNDQIAEAGDDGEISGAWHRTGYLIEGWARISLLGADAVIPSGFVRISLPFNPDHSIMDVATTTTGQVFTVGSGMVESDVDGLVYTRIVPNDVTGAIDGSHVIRCMRDEVSGSLSWVNFLVGDDLTVNFAYVADPLDLIAKLGT